MESIVLIIHLLGAGILGILIISAINQLSKRTGLRHIGRSIQHAKLIAVNTVIQFMSGSLLMIAGSGMTLWRFCINVVFYLIVVIAIEIMLYVRIKKLSGDFPVRVMQVSGGLSLVFIMAGLII